LSIFTICKSKNVGIVYDVVAVLSDNKTSRHPVILLVVVIIVQASGVPDKPAFIRYVFVAHEGICQSCHIFVDEFISLLSKESCGSPKKFPKTLESITFSLLVFDQLFLIFIS